MKEFKKIETEIGYEDPKMVVLISMDKGDYELFERACHHNHEKPTELLREIMESYAYADEEGKLEEKYLENFISKGVDDKLAALYTKLCRLENRLNKCSNNGTGYINGSDDSGEDESLPFK